MMTESERWAPSTETLFKINQNVNVHLYAQRDYYSSGFLSLTSIVVLSAPVMALGKTPKNFTG